MSYLVDIARNPFDVRGEVSRIPEELVGSTAGNEVTPLILGGLAIAALASGGGSSVIREPLIKRHPNTPNTCLLYTSPSPRD